MIGHSLGRMGSRICNSNKLKAISFMIEFMIWGFQGSCWMMGGTTTRPCGACTKGFRTGSVRWPTSCRQWRWVALACGFPLGEVILSHVASGWNMGGSKGLSQSGLPAFFSCTASTYHACVFYTSYRCVLIFFTFTVNTNRTWETHSHHPPPTSTPALLLTSHLPPPTSHQLATCVLVHCRCAHSARLVAPIGLKSTPMVSASPAQNTSAASWKLAASLCLHMAHASSSLMESLAGL